MMKRLFTLCIVHCALCICLAQGVDHARMNQFVDNLMAQMTLQEKLGQLNLPVTGDIITGTAVSGNVVDQIKAGKVGGLFNMKGVKNIRQLQEVAVKQSRLGIPLIFGIILLVIATIVFVHPVFLSVTGSF